jgi:hypothetical protein
MVYNTQNYWVFGLCPLSRVPKTTIRKLDLHTPEIKTESSWKYLSFRSMPALSQFLLYSFPANSPWHILVLGIYIALVILA